MSLSHRVTGIACVYGAETIAGNVAIAVDGFAKLGRKNAGVARITFADLMCQNQLARAVNGQESVAIAEVLRFASSLGGTFPCSR